MVHREVKHGYHIIQVKNPPESEEIIEMFIGRFESDNEYHLLGFRNEDNNYCPENTETNQDLGIVRIPTNKKKLTDLVTDEIFFILPKKEKAYPVKFVSYN